MAWTTMLFGAILTAIGVGGYFAVEQASWMALIPAALGAPLLVSGLLALKPAFRQNAMRAAVFLTLLGRVGRPTRWCDSATRAPRVGPRDRMVTAILCGAFCGSRSVVPRNARVTGRGRAITCRAVSESAPRTPRHELSACEKSTSPRARRVGSDFIVTHNNRIPMRWRPVWAYGCWQGETRCNLRLLASGFLARAENRPCSTSRSLPELVREMAYPAARRGAGDCQPGIRLLVR
jgi:hypothetical protein